MCVARPSSKEGACALLCRPRRCPRQHRFVATTSAAELPRRVPYRFPRPAPRRPSLDAPWVLVPPLVKPQSVVMTNTRRVTPLGVRCQSRYPILLLLYASHARMHAECSAFTTDRGAMCDPSRMAGAVDGEPVPLAPPSAVVGLRVARRAGCRAGVCRRRRRHRRAPGTARARPRSRRRRPRCRPHRRRRSPRHRSPSPADPGDPRRPSALVSQHFHRPAPRSPRSALRTPSAVRVAVRASPARHRRLVRRSVERWCHAAIRPDAAHGAGPAIAGPRDPASASAAVGRPMGRPLVTSSTPLASSSSIVCRHETHVLVNVDEFAECNGW